MRRLSYVILLCLLSAAAVAGDTYRFIKGVVSVGGTVVELVQKAGKPDRTIELENEYGAVIGERWEYYIGNKLVNFYIHDGRITKIEQP